MSRPISASLLLKQLANHTPQPQETNSWKRSSFKQGFFEFAIGGQGDTTPPKLAQLLQCMRVASTSFTCRILYWPLLSEHLGRAAAQTPGLRFSSACSTLNFALQRFHRVPKMANLHLRWPSTRETKQARRPMLGDALHMVSKHVKIRRLTFPVNSRRNNHELVHKHAVWYEKRNNKYCA